MYNHKIPIHHKQARHFANWIALLRDQNKRLDLETKELRKAVCELQKGLQSIIADTKQSQIWKEKGGKENGRKRNLYYHNRNN